MWLEKETPTRLWENIVTTLRSADEKGEAIDMGWFPVTAS